MIFHIANFKPFKRQTRRRVTLSTNFPLGCGTVLDGKYMEGLICQSVVKLKTNLPISSRTWSNRCIVILVKQAEERLFRSKYLNQYVRNSQTVLLWVVSHCIDY